MPDAVKLLEEIRAWVEIETPTSAPQAVERLMDRVAAGFSTLGAPVSWIEGINGRGKHLEVRSPWGGDGPGILILSHLDTVHPVGTLADRLPFRIEGDRAYGPGIYDMKGGAFLGFAAFRELVREGKPTPLPLRWLFTSDEEVGSPTSRDHIRKAGDLARYVLVTEPGRDGGKCVTARKGTARHAIHFTGRPAHSGSRHAAGRSAIREMARHILELEAITDYEVGITTNVGIVSGGTAVNTIPEQARLDLDLRFPSEAAMNTALAAVRNRVSHDPDVSIRIEGGVDRPPYEKSPATAALFEHARVLAAELGFELDDTMSGGGSDGNFLAGRLPVLDGIGVDGDGAHTYHEHLLISSIVPRMQLMKRLMETLE
ncbi:MAG: M20 family metallopeptidase [Geminicoccaceae bacterium]|nr:M20 family metallopeptidase [Geminicoccaceae bacterium]MCB9945726.1 M20 family metallopeptidase [Geminicoccaceae bacterium]